VLVLPTELRTFFELYAAAFNALDDHAIASLYAEPSAIAQGGTFTCWPTRADVHRNMAALCKLYQGRGFQSTAWEPAAYLRQGSSYAVVDLRWHIRWHEPAAPWTFNTTYNLTRGAAGWRIFLCTAYDEDKLHQRSLTDPAAR
jgi:hypothetical protein